MNALKRFLAFLREVREEIAHVSWPTWEELIGSAVVVFVGVAILGGYIYVWDQVLTLAVRGLLR